MSARVAHLTPVPMSELFFQRRQNVGSACITLIFWVLNYFYVFYRRVRLAKDHNG
jgi:hypothetical protein